MVVGSVTTTNKSRSTQNKVLNNNYTDLTTNTETSNTQCQPSATIRRSIRRYISASDRPTGKERGGGKIGRAPRRERDERGSSRAQGWTEMRLLALLLLAARLVLVEATLSGTNISFSFSFFSAKRIENYFTSLLNTCSIKLRHRKMKVPRLSISLIISNICEQGQKARSGILRRIGPMISRKTMKQLRFISSSKFSLNQ